MDYVSIDFKINVINEPFVSESGKTYDKTAVISFNDIHGNIRKVVKYGFINKEYIYQLIDNNENINLNNCYITEFSLSEYRKTKGLEASTIVSINGFSANNSFWDCNQIVDFSHASFSKGGVDFSHSCFKNGTINFHGAKFGDGEVNFGHIHFGNGDVDFSSTVFGTGGLIFNGTSFGFGKKDFQYADFGKGMTSFVSTDFGKGEVSFVNTNFNDGKVTFKVAIFGDGKVDFHFSKFGDGDISFERTEFGDGKVDFRTVEFGVGRLNFNRSIFGKGEISFESSELKEGKASFRRVDFGEGDISFEMIEFHDTEIEFEKVIFGKGNTSFYKANVKKLLFESCHLDSYFDFRVAKSSYIDLSNTIVRDIIDLQPEDENMDIKILNIKGMRIIGRIYIDWRKNKVKDLICRQLKTSNREKAEQFRILKENFNNTGQYIDEDKSYIEFKRYEQKAELEEAVKANPFNAVWAYPTYWTKLLIFDKVGLYATEPLRVMFSMLVCYTLFSLLYIILLSTYSSDIVSSIGDPDKLTIIQRSFYHSSVTFLTIGYGDYYPSGIIRWISAIEGFAGLFLMSYFTVAFVRKILR